MLEEKKSLDPNRVNRDDLMAFVYWAKVGSSSRNSAQLENVDTGDLFNVVGARLIEDAYSADFYDSTEKVTKTRAAEILVASRNIPFTVRFEKTDGTLRSLRGRLVKPEPLLGRSMVEDLDIDSSKHRLRQVDHRTIIYLIVNGTKYLVK